MELDSLNKALNKLAPHMLRNIPVEFTISINKSQYYDASFDYAITYTFTIDHSKFWKGKSFAGEPNPNFDENYWNGVNNIYFGEYESLLEDTPKYLGINDFNVYILYNHINTDIYEPLVNYLHEKEDPTSFKIKFTVSSPVLIIDIINFNIELDDLYLDLNNEGFDMEDIIIS